MIINVENKSESELLIEYNGTTHRIAGSKIEQIEIDSLDIELTAHMVLIDELDLELDNKKLKNKLIQKATNKIINFTKKLMAQCKITYAISLNQDDALLTFEFDGFGKDNSFIQDLLDMPFEIVNFARLECDNAEIKVTDCEVINKKEYLKTYRRIYFWINWNIFEFLTNLVLYLPSYLKQKRIMSKRYLLKAFGKLYSLPRDEREKLLGFSTDDEKNEDEDDKKGKSGCLGTFVKIGVFVLIMLAILIALIVWIAKSR